MDFLNNSIRTPADLAVSWLNFEPRVSKLPAVSADVADTAHAIIGSLFLFNGYKLGYVWKESSYSSIITIRTLFCFMIEIYIFYALYDTMDCD